MVTLVGTHGEFEHVLKDLIELEYDAIEAYKASIDRFEANEYRDQFSNFLTDHNRHLKELTELARKMGVEAPSGPDAKQLLTKGKVIMANMMGDSAILTAMKTNEDDTVTAYERTLTLKDLPEDARPIVVKGLADEKRHRAWIETASKVSAKHAA